MPCEYDKEYKCGDSLYDLTRKILGRLKELVGFGPGGSGGEVTLTVSDVEIGAVEIKDSSTDNRATVRNTDPAPTDYGLVVRNIPSGVQEVGGNWENSLVNIDINTSNVATETSLNALQSSIEARLNTLGQKTMALSAPVVIASNQSAIPVTGPLTDAQLRAAAVPISAASLPLPAGAATETTLSNISGNAQDSRNLAYAYAGPSAPTFATVGVASAEVVPENLARAALYLTNTSNNVISLSFGNAVAAVLNSGITLFPGDSFAMLRPGWNFDGPVNAIAGAAGSNLAIQEMSA